MLRPLAWEASRAGCGEHECMAQSGQSMRLQSWQQPCCLAPVVLDCWCLTAVLPMAVPTLGWGWVPWTEPRHGCGGVRQLCDQTHLDRS